MYQSLLTRRYLLTKVMPLLAVVSVALCNMMLLVTWSVMGGFLVMLLDIGGRIEGDVSISWPTAGYPYYDELIDRLEKDPMVAGAAPTIDAFGMVTLADDRAIGVKIKGIDERFAKVSDYANQVWWKPIQKPLPKDYHLDDPRLPDDGLPTSDPHKKFRFDADILERVYQNGLHLQAADPVTHQRTPAAVLGIESTGFTKRYPGGYYLPAAQIGRRNTRGEIEWVPGWTVRQRITIRVIPMDAKGRDMSTFVSRTLPVANEFRTGLFEADKNTVLLNLQVLQQMLKMDAAERVDDARPTSPYAIEGSGSAEQLQHRKVIGVEPARVTTVLVKAQPGIDSETLRARCQTIYAAFADAHPGEVPTIEMMDQSHTISTWERQLATFIGAVKNETVMVVGLLMLMSAVCAVLILCIFWAMVSEKTRDIGILRAVGAGRLGIAWIWLRYGLVIGVVGGGVGLLAGSLIVWNINPIHDWLGEQFGIKIWDPSVYYFPTIPSHVEALKAAQVILSGVLFCTLGALVPAIRAAYMDPVRALRFE